MLWLDWGLVGLGLVGLCGVDEMNYNYCLELV